MTLSALRTDIIAWCNRKNDADFIAAVPGFIALAEERITTALRAKCMVQRATMPIAAGYLPLPCDWIAFLDVRVQGEPHPLTLLSRLDPEPHTGGRACAYRLVDGQVEVLPHRVVDPAVPPQVLEVSYYAKPMALVADDDTNPVLEAHPSTYLFTSVLFAALWLKDEQLLAQANDLAASAVAMANTWHDSARFSGGRLNSLARAF